MIQYTIQFELFPDKVDEFILSWKSFYENTMEFEGLKLCEMTEIKDYNYEIKMNWSEKFYLNMFLNGEWNNFLQGAINVLGSENMITQKTIQ
jgi:hypothetical protein